jgi:hypothetical protein
VLRREQPSPASIYHAQKIGWYDLMVKRVQLVGKLANHLQHITHQEEAR